MTERLCRCEAALALVDAAQDVIASSGSALNAAVSQLDDAVQTFSIVYPKMLHCCPLAGGGNPACRATPTTADAASRFRVALTIVRPGACDPSGVALAIVDACRQVRLEGSSPVADPAVRLMATQLAWICGVDIDTDPYAELIAHCTRSGVVGQRS